MLSRQGACAVCASERLRQADEKAPPGSELRRADTNARAVADFVFFIEQVDHVEARGETFRVPEVERAADSQIDLDIARHVLAVRRRAVLPEPRAVDQVGAEARAQPSV